MNIEFEVILLDLAPGVARESIISFALEVCQSETYAQNKHKVYDKAPKEVIFGDVLPKYTCCTVCPDGRFSIKVFQDRNIKTIASGFIMQRLYFICGKKTPGVRQKKYPTLADAAKEFFNYPGTMGPGNLKYFLETYPEAIFDHIKNECCAPCESPNGEQYGIQSALFSINLEQP